MTICPAPHSPPEKRNWAELMRSIAFVTQKGGSGKSTLASSVAVAAHEQGERVCLVDLDPQATLVQWAKMRDAFDIPVIASTQAKLPALLQALNKRGFTLAILDTPGAEGAASLAAIQAADLSDSTRRAASRPIIEGKDGTERAMRARACDLAASRR